MEMICNKNEQNTIIMFEDGYINDLIVTHSPLCESVFGQTDDSQVFSL